MSFEGFRALVADPPWAFKDRLPGKGRGAAKHYPTVNVYDLCRFQIPKMQASSVLFLWRVSAMQEEALTVCRTWGFVPKTELVWNKLTVSGKQHFGMGRIVRAAHETCLIGVRGRSPEILSHSIRSTFSAPVGEHSAKPDAFYEIVEGLVAGRYCELFARRQRPGWSCFGDGVGRATPPREMRAL